MNPNQVKKRIEKNRRALRVIDAIEPNFDLELDFNDIDADSENDRQTAAAKRQASLNSAAASKRTKAGKRRDKAKVAVPDGSRAKRKCRRATDRHRREVVDNGGAAQSATADVDNLANADELGGLEGLSASDRPREPKSVRSKSAYKAKQAKKALHAAAKMTKSTRGRYPTDVGPIADGGTDFSASSIKVSVKSSRAPKTTKNPRKKGRQLKAEQVCNLPNGSRVELSGFRAGGKRYVHFREGSKEAVTLYSAWGGSSGEGCAALAKHDIILIGSRAEVAGLAAQMKRFPRVPAATRSGFFREGFALPNGKILMPLGQRRPLRAFAPAFEITATGGTFDGWKSGVAAPLGDHLLASFFMMTMFAPALLRMSGLEGNFGLELAGLPGRGKTTLLLLMASAAGRALGGDGATYGRTLNGTMNALEETLSLYNDMPLLLDEAALLSGAGSKAARAIQMRDMAFRFSVGQLRLRLGEQPGPVSRLIYVISTNRPLASLLGGAHTAEAEAVNDRLITLLLTENRPHGIFDMCPPEHPSTGAFADALKLAAREHYGHALPAFLQHVVQVRADHPKGLLKWIGRRIARFVRQCGADSNDGSQRRVAEAFGLIYAAGKLAQRASILPENYRCMEAALTAYRLHRAHGRGTRSFDDRLRAIIGHPDTIDLEKVDITKLTADQIGACRAFLYTGRAGDRELLVPVNYRHHHFSDWNSIRNDPDVERRLKGSKDRNTKDRPIMRGWDKPFYCFDITGIER